MKLKRFNDLLMNAKISVVLSRFFNSIYFPVLTAAVVLTFYYLGLDILTIWYVCICCTLIFLTCKDVTPVLCVFLFMGIMISQKNTPSPNGASSDFFERTENLVQIGLGISLAICTAVYRVVVSALSGKLRLSPVFWSLVVLSVAFLLNGVLSDGYKPENLLYGAVLAGLFLGIYTVAVGNITVDGRTFKKVAFYLIVHFLVLAAEIIVLYAKTENLISDDRVNRELLFFGWGTYNNFGMMVCTTLPAWFYLAGSVKCGFLYIFGGAANLIIAFMSMSRQAMLVSLFLFIVCCIWLIVRSKGERRAAAAAVIAFIVVVAVILYNGYYEDLKKFLEPLFENLKTGSGRLALWKEGIKNFLSNPLFGIGFYGGDISAWDYGAAGMEFIPRMYHNTFVQLAASCGLVGLLAYIAHRTQTVISFFNNPSHERLFLVLAACGILLTSLLDNHIFYLFPTLVYSTLLSLLTLTEKREKRKI